MPRPIALLTDFGYSDAYAGVMKGVILARVPDALIFDLTHGIPAQNVRAGALQLLAAASYCPADCVFLAVVDPGVGGPRRPLCLRSGSRLFVGPDNGLLWPAAAACGAPEAWVLDRPEHWLGTPSATFHGRDLFAPVAAALAGGADPADLGSPLFDPVRWEVPAPVSGPAGVQGEILVIDGFGNCVTNLRPPLPGGTVAAAGQVIPVGSHYGAVGIGEPVVVLGSLGFYEIAVRGGNAAAALGLCEGDPVAAPGVGS